MNKGPRTQPSKIGYEGVPNRTMPDQPKPAAEQGGGENRLYLDTYITKSPLTSDTPTEIIYNGDRQWAQVTLTLETAGPVAVGTVAKITPVLSGKGILLETDVPMTFTVARGTRLYIATTSVNRIKREVSSVPWLEQITGSIARVVNAIANLGGLRR